MTLPYGSEFKFFSLEGVPVRIKSADSLPEILRPSGEWEPYYDQAGFMLRADPVDEEEFRSLVEEFQSTEGS